MFGDGSWLDERTRGQPERFRLWVEGLEKARARFVVVELGAGTAVPTVRQRISFFGVGSIGAPFLLDAALT